MRQKVCIICVFFVLVIVFPKLRASSMPQENTAKQIEQLKKQVDALEQKVKDLEGRLKQLTIMIPQAFPNLHRLPKGWEKREFNGREFYVIPIEQNPDKAKTVIR
jgi:septal ring factor EnvC (AmiA/AmiB activator)